MKTQFIQIQGQSLAVHDSEGGGRAIVLVHGNSSSGLTFRSQLDSPLGKSHRLIALDLPGHGQSERAREPASQYSAPGYAQTVVDLCQHLGLEDAVFVGWSLGGHILLEASALLPRAAGFMIYGTPPIGFPPAMAAAYFPHPAMAAAFSAELSDAQIQAYVEAFLRPGANLSMEDFKADVRRTDGAARQGLALSLQAGAYRDEIDVVAGLRLPLAVLHGAQEQLVNGAYFAGLSIPTLWRAAVQTVANAGHAVHWEQPEAFNVLLQDFAQDCQSAA